MYIDKQRLMIWKKEEEHHPLSNLFTHTNVLVGLCNSVFWLIAHSKTCIETQCSCLLIIPLPSFSQVSIATHNNHTPILTTCHVVICGGLFYQVSNTIAGFQNRMGLFFFYEALLGFMCLTSLQVFSNERILFVRERANGYYSPGIYFLSKAS